MFDLVLGWISACKNYSPAFAESLIDILRRNWIFIQFWDAGLLCQRSVCNLSGDQEPIDKSFELIDRVT